MFVLNKQKKKKNNEHLFQLIVAVEFKETWKTCANIKHPAND